MWKDCKAFTMIELLLVLAILGALVAIIIPSIGGGMAGTQMATTARSVIQAARYARSMAIVHQAETELVLTSAKEEGGRSVVEVRAVKREKDLFQTRGIGEGYSNWNREDRDETEGEVVTNSTLATAEAAKNYAEEIGVTFESKGIVFLFEGYDDFIDNEKMTNGGADEEREKLEENPPIQVRFTSNGRCRPFSVRVTDGGELSYLVRIDVTGGGRIEGYGDEEK